MSRRSHFLTTINIQRIYYNNITFFVVLLTTKQKCDKYVQ